MLDRLLSTTVFVIVLRASDAVSAFVVLLCVSAKLPEGTIVPEAKEAARGEIQRPVCCARDFRSGRYKRQPLTLDSTRLSPARLQGPLKSRVRFSCVFHAVQ